MNDQKISLEVWKERFIKMQQELYRRDSGFPVMPLMVSIQAMLGYVQFTLSLIDEKLELEEEIKNLRDTCI